MRKKIITLLLIITIISIYGYKATPPKELEIVGTYISKRPNFSEKTSLMYSKGYFNFVYTAPNNDILILNDNGTFTYSSATCNNGATQHSGKWKYENNEVILSYNNNKLKKNKRCRTKNNMIYSIDNFITSENDKTIKCLTLLEKQFKK